MIPRSDLKERYCLASNEEASFLVAVRLHSGFQIFHEIDLKAGDLVESVGILVLFIREAAREFSVLYPQNYHLNLDVRMMSPIPPVDCNQLDFSRFGLGGFNQIDLVGVTIKQSM